jgi:hypothetical protein
MLRLYCAAVLTAALGIWLVPGKAGYIFGLTFAVIVVFTLIARELFRLPRCPACQAPAEIDPHKRQHIWFPYGWMTRCRSCGLDLTAPYRRSGPSDAAPGAPLPRTAGPDT